MVTEHRPWHGKLNAFSRIEVEEMFQIPVGKDV
jgi:hypothetical protein